MAIAPSLEGAVVEAAILVREIDILDLKEAPPLWRLADLTAENTHGPGGTARSRANSERLTIVEWAKQIGWTQLGRSESTLSDMVKISRAWPTGLRIECREIENRDGSKDLEGVSFWQHREALTHFKGDVEKASKWLASHDRPRSVRDVTRSGVMGTGPIYDAIRVLARARAGIIRVPGILAAADALGTEPNFDQLRNEVKRLKRGMSYLDRYLADEITIDMEEFQAGLDKILKETS